MMTEDDVVEAVCRYLQRNQYRIVRRCTTNDHGEDIVAAHSSGITLRIEAKGETSNDSTSKRFGRPFDNSQVETHVAKAFYTAAATLNSDRGRVGVAFPETRLHRKHVGRISAAVQKLGIAVFWVDAEGAVTQRPGVGLDVSDHNKP
jgi:Holliday junction resolvase-like predicted endonuclease